MLIKVLVVFICYLIGNISSSILISKMIAGIDIREHGSGNAGTTNVLRTLGKKAAAATLAGDVLKGVIAVVLGRLVGGEELAMICGLVAVIGHIWPLMFGFRGGKGIATGMGAIVVTTPFLALICIIIGIVVIVISRYVSLGSITGAAALPIVAFFLDKHYFIWALFFAIIAVYTHRKNIERLINRTESKISFSK